MKLEEVLNTLSGETYVGIWDIRRSPPHNIGKHEKCPTRQTYSKVRNLPYGEVRNLLWLDVLHINVVDNGLLIRVYDRDETQRNVNYSKLATKIAQAIKREATP